MLEKFSGKDIKSLNFMLLVMEDETSYMYKVVDKVTTRVSVQKEVVHKKDVDKDFCSFKRFEVRVIP